MKDVLICVGSLLLVPVTLCPLLIAIPHKLSAWCLLSLVVAWAVSTLISPKRRAAFLMLCALACALNWTHWGWRALLPHDVVRMPLSAVRVFVRDRGQVFSDSHVATVTDPQASAELETYFRRVHIETVVKSLSDYRVELESNGSHQNWYVCGDGFRHPGPASAIQDFYSPLRPGLSAYLDELIRKAEAERVADPGS
jgi:hypothetical protein